LRRCRVCCATVLAVLIAPLAHAQSLSDDWSRLSRSLEAMVENVAPAVVQVFVSGTVGRGGIVQATGDLLSRQRATGSGVVLAADGYVITNAHVVAGARRLQVRLSGVRTAAPTGKSILAPPGELLGAQLVGIDAETDLALLKVARQGLFHLDLADSDSLRAGQIVVAFGSPLGLENSVTMGVVSSVARQLREDEPMIYIQTDAPINPGNSGGPLVDAKGRVVGINTLIFSRSGGSEGIGFAAPSNIVKNIFEQLRSTGTVRRGTIGVVAQTITPALSAALALQRDRGVILGDVLPGSPAEKAGLRVGDVVVALDGKPMENGRQFEINLYRFRAGQSVNVAIERGGGSHTLPVAVIERPDVTGELMRLVRPEDNVVAELGVLALDLVPEVIARLGPLRHPHGVVVVGRAADAPYVDLGILPGDVIHQLNGQAVRNLQELRRELAKLTTYTPVVLQIERDGLLQYVAFELE